MRVIDGRCSECHQESRVVLIGDVEEHALLCFECIERLVAIPEVYHHRFPNIKSKGSTTIEFGSPSIGPLEDY